MIVCKIYVDVIKGQKCIVTECTKENVSKGMVFISNALDGEYGSAMVYPSTAIAISKEAKELLYWLVDNVENRKKNVFLSDYNFMIEDYENNIGAFSFLPTNEEGETERKKIFYINKRPVYINSEEKWTRIMENMQLLDNEFLKNLDLTEPVEI